MARTKRRTAKRSPPRRKSAASPSSALARALRERDEALAFQAASGDILSAISRSPADATPVFEAIVNNVRRLFGTRYVAVFLVKGEELHVAASRGDAAFEKKYGAAFRKFRQSFPQRIDYGGFTGKALRSGKVVQIAPIIGNPAATPQAVVLAKSFGYDAMLVAPLMREGKAIGAIGTTRPEAQPFDPKALALFKAFADQAVIAIENARLFNETKEALEQQTATAEILKVIASSPAQLAPVLDAVAKRAAALCQASDARVFLSDGDTMVYLAGSGDLPVVVNKLPLSRGSVVGRAVIDRDAVQVVDILGPDGDAFPLGREVAMRTGWRTSLAVPLMRDGRALGAITLRKRQAQAFSEKQVALLRTFSDQAVIAIDNARLFNKTKEALERQTATADILKVISSSPTDVQPVFDAIARNATKLCESAYANVFRYDGERLHWVASQGGSQEVLGELRKSYPMPPNPGRVVGRVVLGGQAIHVEDTLADPAYDKAFASQLPHRRILGVALLRAGKPVGAITVAWAEPGPILPRHEELLKIFADQAVIAIENVRLFNETKTSLEQQTATAEILKVISGSPTDVQPVFDAIVGGVSRLFGRKAALRTVEAEGLRRRARSYEPGPDEYHGRDVEPLDRRAIVGQAVIEGRALQWRDTLVEGAASYGLEEARKLAFRSIASAPLMRGGRAIGVISVSSPTPGMLTDSQMELLSTFADQAVIAIENTRLFNETKEALDQQKASAEVLGAISGSIADVKPVFDKILESCQRLFAGKRVGINLVGEDGRIHLGAYEGPGREAFEKVFPLLVDRNSGSGLCILEKRLLHYPDIEADDVPEAARRGQHATGSKAGLFAPMLWQDQAIGVIFVARGHVGPFSAKEIALLRTFADQAVIAIQNARLVNETREALEQQTATADVLKVMSGSPTDVQPVFNAILESAVTLCGAELAAVFSYDGKLVHLGATYKWPEEAVRYFSRIYPSPPSPKLISGRTILSKSVVQIADSAADPNYDPNSVITGHWRRMLGAPMLREGRPLGALVVAWRDPGETPQRQVELLQTFADQAAIAIENVRLFNETKEALDQQKAAADVLQVISSSIEDTKPVFERILESCRRLFGGHDTGIGLVGEDGLVHLAAHRGPMAEELQKVFPVPLSRESGTGSAILEGTVKHYPDVFGEPNVPEYVRRSATKVDFKSVIFAPMYWEGRGIGAIWVGRSLAGAFTEKQIALLKTFADQAVIAIQNARLFREIQEKSAQLEVANKHKSDFLANMSHELRTPLNAIIGFSEVLSDRMFGEVNAKQAEYLKDIHESGRHLLSLINDILDLSKIEAGRMDLELSSFDLPSAVSNAMTLVRERAQRHGIRLGLEMDPRLGELQADERKVKQILLNLLSNAVKFTPDGGKVDVCTRKMDGKVEIAVRDTGIGIAAEDHAAVFEEFKQVGRDYTRKAEGTGLGLALTKRLVELHGGEIGLESALGKGSTFTVKLPLR
jgi:GAF domain-containing protein